jgi:hypothetical protein
MSAQEGGPKGEDEEAEDEAPAGDACLLAIIAGSLDPITGCIGCGMIPAREDGEAVHC